MSQVSEARGAGIDADVAVVLYALVVALIMVVGAEFVRANCRRQLMRPVEARIADTGAAARR